MKAIQTKALFAISALAAMPLVAAHADVTNLKTRDLSTDWQDMEINRTFSKHLAQDYQMLSKAQANDWDIMDPATFQSRSVAATNGKYVPPMKLDQIDFVGSSYDELAQARQQLTNVLNSGVKAAHPAEVAEAQVAFDCWAVQQQAGPNMSHNMSSCQPAFEQKIAALEGTRQAMAAENEEPKVAVHEVYRKTVAVPMVMPMKTVHQESYTVHFAHNSAALTAGAKQELDRLKAFMEKHEDAKLSVNIRGYADTTGGQEYNAKLSRNRAKTVADYLGVEPGNEKVSLKYFGENNLPVPTPDNTNMPANRVAEVTVEKVMMRTQRLSSLFLE